MFRHVTHPGNLFHIPTTYIHYLHKINKDITPEALGSIHIYCQFSLDDVDDGSPRNVVLERNVLARKVGDYCCRCSEKREIAFVGFDCADRQRNHFPLLLVHSGFGPQLLKEDQQSVGEKRG